MQIQLLVWLNFDLGLYLDCTFHLRLSLSQNFKVSAQQMFQQKAKSKSEVTNWLSPLSYADGMLLSRQIASELH